MSKGTWTLTLSYPHADRENIGVFRYRVEKIVNSTAYQPTHYLSKEEVDKLCQHEYWEVIQIPVKGG